MLHGIRINYGEAFYSNHFIQTKSTNYEKKYNKEPFLGLGEFTDSFYGILKGILWYFRFKFGFLKDIPESESYSPATNGNNFWMLLFPSNLCLFESLSPK